MTPEQRLNAISEILSKGVLRLLDEQQKTPSKEKGSGDEIQVCLIQKPREENQ